MSEDPPKAKNPWIAHSERKEYEDCITGNTEGLTLLRDAIDRALVSKKEEIKIQFSDIRGVFVIEGDRRDVPPRKLRWTPKVGQDGSLTQSQKNDPNVQEATSAQS